ncbi:MAG: DUF2784 domain-containing protein [Gemmataceae bacterium]
MYGILADVVVALHVGYVAYVIFGQLAIVVAAPFRWSWARNPYFRWSHLTAIGIVAYEAIMNIRCPLSVWEEQLRHAAGQGFDSSQTFMGRLLHNLLFIEGMPEVFFTTLYLATLAIVLQGLIMYPPRGFRVRRNSPAPAMAT